MIDITCLSDLHGFYPPLDGGDLLICAGDITPSNKVKQWMEFFKWFISQPYRKKILVAGNHDGFLERCISSQEAREMMIDQEEGFEYLCDSGIEFEGFNIWGSPWVPKFYNWSFMLPRGDRIRQKWELIPDNTQILVTHGPPFGVLDRNYEGILCGCEDLGNRLKHLNDLKLHVFGHIHEGYGIIDATHKSVNCSIMDREYKPVNKPIKITLSKK